MPALLIDPENVRIRGGYSDNGDVVAGLVSAVSSATLFLEEALSTAFKLGTTSDIFFLTEKDRKRSLDKIQLMLSEGFVDLTASFDIYRFHHLDESAAATDTVDLSIVILLGKTGHVLIEDLHHTEFDRLENRTYLRVEYTHGFATSNTSENQVVYTGVPEWLKEAATLASLGLYETVITCGKKAKGHVSFDSLVGRLIEGHLRDRTAYLSPINR